MEQIVGDNTNNGGDGAASVGVVTNSTDESR